MSPRFVADVLARYGLTVEQFIAADIDELEEHELRDLWLMTTFRACLDDTGRHLAIRTSVFALVIDEATARPAVRLEYDRDFGSEPDDTRLGSIAAAQRTSRSTVRPRSSRMPRQSAVSAFGAWRSSTFLSADAGSGPLHPTPTEFAERPADNPFDLDFTVGLARIELATSSLSGHSAGLIVTREAPASRP